jgi:hypothetical protein
MTKKNMDNEFAKDFVSKLATEPDNSKRLFSDEIT